MELQNAIEHTINKGGMKVSVSGMIGNITGSRGRIDNGTKYTAGEFAKHYQQAREA